MTSQQTEDRVIHKRLHSKAFKEGLGILTEEIELALQWNRPSILLAVHKSTTGRLDAKQSLEQQLIKRNKQVMHIKVESANPDVIRVMSETPNPENRIFFVSGIENADQASDGRVYRALNIRRELLVERCICVVFWLNESELTNLPRLAPDFWAFRHRVVEFAPKHGSKKQSVPVGLFLWEEHIPWMEKGETKKKLAYYEEYLMQLPKEDGAITARIETLLKLAHYSWLLNDFKKFSDYLNDGMGILKKYPIPQYQAWMLNAKGIGLFEEGNKMDATAHFTQALSHNPDNYAIMMNTSVATYGLGRNRDAILMGQRAVKLDPGNFQLWCVLGYLNLSMGKIENAIDAMAKAREISEENMDVHYSLAVCYYKNEQSAECERELSKVGKISEQQNAIQYACTDILGGKRDEAITHLKHSLDTGEIDKHHIRRDPNLFFLLNPSEVMELN